MKKIITISSVLMLIAFILPSCGMNVVKRQHRGGYYITTNQGYKHAKNEAREDNLVTERETIRPETIGNAKPETLSAAEQANEEVVAVNTPEAPVADHTVEVNGTENNTVAAYNSQPVHKKTILDNKFVNKALERMPMTKRLDAKVKQAQESSARGDGLSLFWIVILVLLLLYVLGVTGHWFPGGLIHVLLIIALVLLILWLLRVL